jgi:hypothetical protein
MSYLVSEIKVLCTYLNGSIPMLTSQLNPIFFTINIESNVQWNDRQFESFVFDALAQQVSFQVEFTLRQAKIIEIAMVDVLVPTRRSYIQVILDFQNLSDFHDFFAEKKKNDRFLTFRIKKNDFVIVNSFSQTDTVRQIEDIQAQLKLETQTSSLQDKAKDLVEFLSSMKSKVQGSPSKL